MPSKHNGGARQVNGAESDFNGAPTTDSRNARRGSNAQIQTVKSALRGQEIDLLRRLGVNWPPSDAAKHINCPFPGHDDRNPSWRWDERERRWFCTCGGGDVIDAVRNMLGGSLGDACDYIRSVFPGDSAAFPFKEKFHETSGSDRAAARAAAEWEKAGPVVDQAERYLLGARGIKLTNWPDSLRFCSALAHRSEDGVFSRRPAIIAAMSRWPGGPVLAIGRIWLAADGGGKAPVRPAKAALAPIKGLACWFGTPGPVLVVVEGIEDALTLLAAGVPFVCAAFTGDNAANIRPPACVREIVFFGDRVKPKEGEPDVGEGLDSVGERVMKAARPVWESAGIAVRTVTARRPCFDANDVLRAKGLEAVRRIIGDKTPASSGGESADQRDDRTQTPDIYAELRELAALDDASFTLNRAEHARPLGLSQTDLKRLVKSEGRKTLRASSPHRPAAAFDWPDLKRDEPNENTAVKPGEAAGPCGQDAVMAKNEAETSDLQNGEPQAEEDRRAALEMAVAELAKIAPVEFTLIKGERAKALGVSKADLTGLVNAARKESAKKERARRVAGGLDWPETKNNGEPHKRSQENIRFFFDHAHRAFV
jgi:hypothetical protein